MTQKTIKVIIAEDESSNRDFLRNILEQHKDMEIVGEAADGREMIALTYKRNPQVLFVDIEMPQLDGMSAVKRLLEKNEDLMVVFVTGHADFAVEAFEVSSFDYILKPFKAARVEKTLDKIRARLQERDREKTQLANLVKSAEKLYVKCGHELHFIDTDSICFVEKDRRKTIIHTAENAYETNESINDLEKRLDPRYFFRSHKCYLINLRQVEKIIPWGYNSCVVRFRNANNDALISRTKVRMLHELLDISLE